jgi:glycerol-3-phosphate acyltransferase PlsY
MGLFFAGILSYCLGSIPSGLLFGKYIWGVDLREHGSKNIGATNAWRILGKGPGLLVFTADLLKGVLGVALGLYFVGTPLAMILGGITAIVGHGWSIFLGFKGGKGVATGLGVVTMLMPHVTLVILGVWIVIVFFSKYVSLGSVIAAALVPIVAYIFDEPLEFLYFGIVAAIFVIYRHKTNIERLINGTESKIRSGHINK